MSGWSIIGLIVILATAVRADSVWHVTSPEERIEIEVGGATLVLLADSAIEIPDEGPPRLNFGTVGVVANVDTFTLETAGGALTFAPDSEGWVQTPHGERWAEVRVAAGSARSRLCYDTVLEASEVIWRLGCPPRRVPRESRHPRLELLSLRPSDR